MIPVLKKNQAKGDDGGTFWYFRSASEEALSKEHLICSLRDGRERTMCKGLEEKKQWPSNFAKALRPKRPQLGAFEEYSDKTSITTRERERGKPKSQAKWQMASWVSSTVLGAVEVLTCCNIVFPSRKFHFCQTERMEIPLQKHWTSAAV